MSEQRRLTPRGKERRRQLLDFAAHRFAENGFHPTAVAEIVSGLGVGKGVFYWYFESKDDLLLAILREGQQDLRRAQQAEIADEADPLKRLEAGMQASMRWFDDNRHVVNLIQFAATEERFAPVVRRGQEVALADLVKHIKDGIVAGEIRDLDPEILAQAVLGVTGQLARELLHRRGEPADAFAAAAIAFCLTGLRA